ncbi:fibrous sheath CABYR-binding protein [Siniperca chuatsi]|uniref:fibrous sheath CABYR-binding protein n=1 Tax=Siniperca chuatsi TaxID=119488 RepID=UPI001CE19CC2|nr:fibrous sheath CABYR-binding protein [Siniperca chuatsi]
MSPVEPAEQPVANTTAENKREYADTTAHQSNVEHNEANVSADVHVEDPVAETSAAASKKGSHPEQAAEEIVEAVAEVVVESSPDKSDAINATPGEEAALRVEPVPDLVADNVSESPTYPGAETATEGSCEKGPPEQAAGETVSAVAEVAVESSPETPAVTDTAGEEAALQDHVETVKSVEGKVESESAGPVLKTRAEEVVECEVQPLFAVVEQSVETTPESTADCVVELNIEDAVEPVTAKDAEAKVACRAIELTDALDVEPPTVETAPEPLKDPKQSHTEETRLSQQSDDTNTSELFQNPVEELRSTQTLIGTRDSTAVCSFCDKIIDGNIKITFSEPLVKCHPDCLKCGVCAKALGDMRTSMFLRNQVIQCDGCFAKALKT